MAKNKEAIKTVQGMLLYACIQNPVDNYDKDGKEWKISVVVDEETAENWDATYPKQSAKAVKLKNFKETYKVDAPTDDPIQYVITLKKPTTDSEGRDLKEQFHPKVMLRTDTGKRLDITQDKLVGNGSTGVVSIFNVDHPKFGMSARLNNVLVFDLVEYVSGEAGSEFDGEFTDGEDDCHDDEFGGQEEKPKRTQSRKSTTPPDADDEPAEKPKQTRRRASTPPPADDTPTDDGDGSDAPWDE